MAMPLTSVRSRQLYSGGADYEYKILEEAKHVTGVNADASGAASRLTLSWMSLRLLNW